MVLRRHCLVLCRGNLILCRHNLIQDGCGFIRGQHMVSSRVAAASSGECTPLSWAAVVWFCADSARASTQSSG